MNPDNTSGGAVANSPTTGAASSAANSHDNLIQLGERSHFNFALAIAWLIALLAILATLYFWWLGKNTIDVITDKNAKLQSIEQQMNAPAMTKAEKDANDFKTSVGILSTAQKSRFSITSFLPLFYTKITNDVKISSLSLSADGGIAIAGTTKSYRTTADLVLALRSWSTLSNVELGSVSVSADEAGKLSAAFSISAKVVKTPAAAASSTSGSTVGSSTQPATGGIK